MPKATADVSRVAGADSDGAPKFRPEQGHRLTDHLKGCEDGEVKGISDYRGGRTFAIFGGFREISQKKVFYDQNKAQRDWRLFHGVCI